jgi:hypothetical protein
VAAAAGIGFGVWKLTRPSPYFYPRPTIGTWSGGTLWGTAEFNRPRLETRAMRVALTDRRVRRIVGRRYRVIGDWSEADGVLLHVRLLGRPRSYDLVLPYASYGTIPDPPLACVPPRFLVGWYRDRARQVTDASLIVNLQQRRVVQIMTSAKLHVTSWVAGKPHPSCPEPLYP